MKLIINRLKLIEMKFIWRF